MNAPTRRVIILGGGFGGVTVAQELTRLIGRIDEPVEITLVSQTNSLLFLPLLAEAAAGSIELTHVLSPLRLLVPRATIRVETVLSVGLERHIVTSLDPATLEERELPWDYLIIALGSVVDLSGLPGVTEHGIPIKTIGDALQIRNRMVHMLEAAACLESRDAREELLTFVVAGGGFSGVEVAAELHDFLVESVRLYPPIDWKEIHVILLHSGGRILPEISEGLAAFAQRKLAERGVEIWLGARLASATATRVHLTDERSISSRTLIVAVGAAANPVIQELDVPKERGRIRVDGTMLVEGLDDVWALGDCAWVPLDGATEVAPPTAQFALREGRTLARNVFAALQGTPPERFAFRGLGQMVSLGHHSAVAEIGNRLKLTGALAWILWRSFYLMRLPGLERKLRVWLDWNLDMIFRRDLAELNVERSQLIASAVYDAGQDIVRQGELAEALYVIQSGEVQVLRRGGAGEVELARLGPGDTFGEVGLLRHQRRNATVRAITRVDVIAIRRSDFDELIGSWKVLASTLETMAHDRDVSSPPQ